MASPHDLALAQYRALAELRYQIRRFLTFSEEAARAAGVEPQQHQLLLVLKALRPPDRPTVRAVAERLQIQHNSAVELVRRAVDRKLVVRSPGAEDRREASLKLTPTGERVLRGLSLAHGSELRSAAPALLHALEAVVARPGAGRERRARGRVVGGSSVGRLPVVALEKPDRLIGILTRSDIIGTHLRRLEGERPSSRGAIPRKTVVKQPGASPAEQQQGRPR